MVNIHTILAKDVLLPSPDTGGNAG